MCGIFGVVGTQSADKIILNGLKKLDYRGYDSWGIAVKHHGKIVCQRQLGQIKQTTTNLPSSSIGLGHTRWATHGGVTVSNAHPHLDCSQKICLVHNGIIENYRFLKQKMVKNHQFKSETDTEIAVHLIEEQAKTQPFYKAVGTAFNQLTGMNALIVLHSQNNQLIAVKNGSPLIIGLGTKQNYIASDVWPLLDHTSRVIFLEDNQIARITKDKVKIFNLLTNRLITPKIHQLNWQEQKSLLGKFHHFMEKEIYDQPKVLTKLAKLNQKILTPVSTALKHSHNNLLIGCGSAYYAALFGDYLLNLAGCPSQAVVGSEFAKHQHLLNQKQVFLMLSQSGETIDLLTALNLAKQKKLTTIAFTNTLGSTLYRQSDQQILLQAGQEKAVASTKAFTAKLTVLIQLYYLLTNRFAFGQTLIKQTAKSIQTILKPQQRRLIKDLAGKIKDKQHLLVIGKMLFYPIALEASLKIKEVSYLHAESFPAGELKHGPIALIESGTPCLIFVPTDSTHDDVISAAHEMKARGGFIIAVSHKKNTLFDFHLPIPDLKVASVIPAVVFAQLLAFDLAIARGLNPDKPRNLAKSVTVK